MNDATRRWATLAAVPPSPGGGSGRDERERQPQVVREADRFLQHHGPWPLPSPAAAGVEGGPCRTRPGRKEEVAWSAGAGGPGDLAIRLGLARQFGRHSEPLPVILDDVLVKFDPSRRQNVARVILEFALEQQVLLFSCHPELVDIMAAVRRDPRAAN